MLIAIRRACRVKQQFYVCGHLPCKSTNLPVFLKFPNMSWRVQILFSSVKVPLRIKQKINK